MQSNEKNRGLYPTFMSLDNFQLPPFLTEQLYKDSLVLLYSKQLINKSLKEDSLSFLGNNQKNILVVVNEENAVYLQDEDLNFLIDILTACKLSLSDTALINFNRNKRISYQSLTDYFKPSVIICLGIELEKLAFPLQFPYYQVQHYNQQQCLCGPSLNKLSADKQEKLQLWASLKKIFAI